MKKNYIIKIFLFDYKFLLISFENIFWNHINRFYWTEIYFEGTKIYYDNT